MNDEVLTEDEANRQDIPFECQMTSDCLCPDGSRKVGCYAEEGTR